MPSGRKNITSVICLDKEGAFWITRNRDLEGLDGTIKQAKTPMNVKFESFPEGYKRLPFYPE